MKIFKRCCIFLMAAIITIEIVEMCGESVFARTCGHRLNGGVTNRYYYVDSSCGSAVAYTIAEAWNDWNNTTDTLLTPIWVTKTSTKSSSSFDFYYIEDVDAKYNRLYAWTEWYPNSSSITQVNLNTEGVPGENWDWTNIKINRDNYITLADINGINEKKSILAHEIGHAMGLAHMTITVENIAIPSIMHIKTYMNTDQCEYQDLSDINSLY